MTTGRRALLAHAPEVVAVFDQVAALPRPDRTDPAVAELADQFALDVSAIDADQRAAFFDATGADAFGTAQRIYAADLVPRLRAVLDAVFGASEWEAVPRYEGDSWALLESFMVAVARLRALDATTTELVRLRGARLHDCAVCRSRRSQDAIDAGATDASFAAVDTWPTSDLPDGIKAALGLTDAIIWSPDDVPADVVTAARAHLKQAQVVEVVLDVMRNAANKIAVALGADAARVTEGVELFTTDRDGNLSVVSAG